jgi:CheY-like chemotaxis protein
MGKRILIVDDSASMRTLVASTLAKAGYETVEAAVGVEGPPSSATSTCRG